MTPKEAIEYLLYTDEKLSQAELNKLTHGFEGMSLAEAKEYFLMKNKRETAQAILRYYVGY